MSTQIKCHIRVEGGTLLSDANAYRIVARSTRATDKMGNRFPSPIYELKNEPQYFQTWRLAKHPKKGYAFVEVANGSGTGGYQPNVRLAVLACICGGLFGHRSDLVVEVLPEGLPIPAPLKMRHPPYNDWYEGAKWCEAKTPKLKEAA